MPISPASKKKTRITIPFFGYCQALRIKELMQMHGLVAISHIWGICHTTTFLTDERTIASVLQDLELAFATCDRGPTIP